MANAREKNLSEFFDTIVDDIFRSTTLTGVNVTTVNAAEANLITLGILNKDHNRNPMDIMVLSRTLNKGIRTGNYSDFFDKLTMMKDYKLTDRESFEKCYEAVFDKKIDAESRGQVAQAMYDITHNKKFNIGNSKIQLDKVLAKQPADKISTKLQEAWQLVSAAYYSEKIFTNSQSKIEYLRAFQGKVLSNFAFPPKDGEETTEKPQLKEDYKNALDKIGEGFNLPSLILERINGAKVPSNLDENAKLPYKLDLVKNYGLKNPGVLGVKTAAEQVNSVMAYPYISALTGAVSSSADLYKNANSDLVSLMCYPGETKEKVFGGKGRWDKYAALVNRSFSVETLNEIGQKGFDLDRWKRWLKDGDKLETPEQISAAVYNMKADMVKRLAERGSFGVTTEKDFARELMSVSLDPDFVKMHLNLETVYESNKFATSPGQKEEDMPKSVMTRVFTPEGYVFSPTRVQRDEEGRLVVNKNTKELVYATAGVRDPEEIVREYNDDGSLKSVSLKDSVTLIDKKGNRFETSVEDRVLGVVAQNQKDAVTEDSEIVLGNTPMTCVAELVYQNEQSKELNKEDQVASSEPHLFRNLNEWKMAYSDAASRIREILN